MAQTRYRISNEIGREASPRTFESIQNELERLYLILSDLSATLTGVVADPGATRDAQYILGAAEGSLPNSRVVTDDTDVAFDLTVAGQLTALFAARDALSVLANATNASARPTAVVAAAASTVFKRNAANALEFAKADLAADVTGRLPYANVTAATAASRLLGRGSAAGAGDWQEITLGAGLTMTGTELAATASGSYYEPITDGDLTQPELLFAGGDVIMAEVP